MLNPLKSFEKSGYIVTYLPVDKHGVVNPDDMKKSITPTTIMVSIMYANGEIGTIEPVKEIGAIIREKGIYFHTDAVAAAGNIPIDIKEAHIDALSISANQFYGPAGVGALYVREGVRTLLPWREACRKAAAGRAWKISLALWVWEKRQNW